MVKTDIFCRAIPWTRLESKRPGGNQDLNIKFSQKASVVLLGMAFLSVMGTIWNIFFLYLAALLLLGIALVNLNLYWFFFTKRGIKFTLFSIVLHFFYFFYSGLSYLYVSFFSKTQFACL